MDNLLRLLIVVDGPYDGADDVGGSQSGVMGIVVEGGGGLWLSDVEADHGLELFSAPPKLGND